MKAIYLNPYLLICATWIASPAIWAGDVIKANNATSLNQTASWVAGVVPGTGDTAVWDSTVTVANSTALGVDTAWGGIRLASPGGLVAIAAGNTLTLGSAGINLSAATQNLSLGTDLVLGADQTWNTQTGRALTLSGLFSSGGKTLTVAGAGTTQILNGGFSGAGGLIKSGTGTFYLGGTSGNVNMALAAGAIVDVQGGTLRNETGGTISWSGNLSSLKVSTGGNFDMGETPVEIDALTDGGVTSTGTVFNSGTAANTLTVGANNGTGTFSGTVKQFGGVFLLSKTGSGSQTLSGSVNNLNLLAEVKSGTLVLGKASTGPGNSSSAGKRAVYGITDIASGATVQLAGTGNEQIYGFGSSYTTVAGTGTVTMSGGTLDFNGKSEGWNILSGSGTIRNNVAATTSTMTLGEDNGSGTFSGTIINGSGTMALTKSGSGSLTLSGANTYSGATSLGSGTLLVTGSLTNSKLTVTGAANSTLGGEGSISEVVLNFSNKLAVDPSTPGALSTGTLSINTTSTPVAVVLAGGGFSPGVPFKVINYNIKGNLWDTTKFALANAASYRTPVFSDSGTAVSLSIGASNIAWNNASADSKWNLGSSINFVGGEKFYTFDTVTFGDAPVGNQVIAVDGTLQPAAWNINSSRDYTFNNGTTGSISGTTGLVKSGTGKATINLTNTFTGATTVSGGILAIASDSVLGTPPPSATPARITLDGGTLALTSAFALNPNRGIAIGAAGGGLDTSAAGSAALVEIGSEITGSGNLSISATGDTNDAPSGTGALVLSNFYNAFTGNVTVTTGLVSMASFLGNPGNPVVLNGGGLVDQGASANFANNILVGAVSGTLRTATFTEISGSIANAPGVTNALLRRTEGGVLTLSGSGAGFAGTYSNLRGATVLKAYDANWAQTAFLLDTNGSTLAFDGGGTASAKSISSTRNVQVNYGTTLDVPSITMVTNAHNFLTTAGDLGGLTSSTGTLTVTNGAVSGTLGTLDHQLQLVLKDFNGFTPLALVKNNTNLLVLSQPNSHSGGTTINMGRLQAPGALSLGSGPVTVNSGGQAYLTTAGVTYANHFTINGIGQAETVGTLGAIRFENNTISGNVTVASGARITAYAASTQGAVNGALLGSGNLETTGSGTINLNGNAAGYTGTLTAAQGTLYLNSPTLGGSLVVADGATLISESTVAGNITLGTTATSNLSFNPSTPGALKAGGALAVNGSVVVSLSGVIPEEGTYKVIEFGSKSGAWTAANFSVGSSFRPGTVFTVNANDVSLTITKAALTWSNATGNSVWDTNNNANFRDSVPATQKFYWGDDVSFTDFPATAQTVTITGIQQPSSVTVNSQYNYTFNAGASGAIAGGTSLLKSGTGMLTLNLANTFTGATTIGQGTLTHSNAAATGSITTGAITLGDSNSGSVGQEVVFTTGIQNLTTATVYKPVTVSSGTGAATLTFNQGAAVANLSINTARAVTLRTTGTGSQSGMMGPITGAGAGAGNDSITFSAPAGANFTYTVGYSGSGIISNTFNGNVRLTGGGNMILQNLVYINPAFENGIIPDTARVTVDSGTTWTLGWGHETIGALDGGGNMVNTSNTTNTLTLGAGNGSGSFTGVMSGGGGVIKNGTGTQELIGANTYTGTNDINAGTLVLSARTAAYGDTTVADGATLKIIGSGGSKWSTGTLMLGAATGATLNIGNFASGINPCVEATQSLAAFGVVTVNVSGVFSGGIYPLIRYPATGMDGAGFGAMVLGTLPAGVTATLEDNGAGMIFLNVTDAGQLTWTGVTSANWDKTTPNWKLSAAAAVFADGANVLFNDTVTPGRSAVVLNTTVSPVGVTFGNGLATPYSLSGSGAIAGTCTLIKNGPGKLTLTNANTFTGGTSVGAGELELGDGATNGSVVGDISNVATVSFNNASPQTFSGVISGTGSLAKKGAGTLTLTGANSYSGATTIDQGTLQIGDGTTNGSFGSGTYTVASGTKLWLNYATATPATTGQWGSRITGEGTLQLKSAQGANGAANWGPNAELSNSFVAGFTGTVQVDNGRLDSSPVGMGGVSKIIIKDGAQFLAWNGTYNIPVEIAGNGWGEVGYPSALRVAAAYNATWAGSITLTANAGILSQDGNSVFTLTGSITGPYECDFIRVGNIFVTPAAAVRNSYGSTKISSNGGTGIVTAGNANALSAGGLLMNGGILALNGYSFDFASLAGSTGEIRNNAATACVMTVGGGNGSSTFSATMTNGSTGTLGLAKTGTGTQTLTSTANSYSGGTTVNQGVLLANNASGSATGSGAIIVNSSGTFGGTGAVTGTVSVNSGGQLAPGAPIESLATGALALSAGSTYAVEINSSGTPAADVTNVTGNVTLGGALALADIATVPVALTLGTKLTIMTYTGALSGTFASLPEAATITAGPNTFKIRYADPKAVTLEVVAGTSNPFTLWATANGVTGGMNGDDDNDGVKNVMEYATNSNPNPATGGAGSGPRCYPLMFTLGTDPALTYTLAVRKNAVFTPTGNKQTATKDQVKYTIEASNNVADWSAVAVTEVTGQSAADIRAALGAKLTTPALGSDWEWRTFRTDGGTLTDPNDFIRLKVEEVVP